MVQTASDMERLGVQLASCVEPGCQIHLSGELGAGKTTLVRGYLSGLGYQGKVKSPTYTLVEPYVVSGRQIYHFDFYRLVDPEEVEAMGFREYPGPDNICLIEWPEKARGFLLEPDLEVAIQLHDSSRSIELQPVTGVGNSLINKLSELI